jgi:hypothetical protein
MRLSLETQVRIAPITHLKVGVTPKKAEGSEPVLPRSNLKTSVEHYRFPSMMKRFGMGAFGVVAGMSGIAHAQDAHVAPVTPVSNTPPGTAAAGAAHVLLDNRHVLPGPSRSLPGSTHGGLVPIHNGSEAHPAIDATPTMLRSVTLAWDMPLTHTDGSPITGPVGIKIYRFAHSRATPNETPLEVRDIGVPICGDNGSGVKSCSYTWAGLANGEVDYWSVKAYLPTAPAAAPVESDYSNEAMSIAHHP